MSLQNQPIKEDEINYILNHIEKFWKKYGEEVINRNKQTIK